MTVVNRKTDALYDVYIGRGRGGQVSDEFGVDGYWGNPIKLEEDTILGRRKCIVAYWRWLTSTDAGRERLSNVHVLKDKILACWCAPELCHGQVLQLLSSGPEGYKKCVQKMKVTYEAVVREENEGK